METTIDCLIIGHNEMNFADYEKKIRKMGINTGAYRDLDLNFVRFNNKPYSASGIFNLFYDGNSGERAGFNSTGAEIKPLAMGDTFSATVAYLGSYLSRRGFSIDFVNSFQDSKEELAEKLKKENILAVAVTTTLYVSVFPIVEIINFIKQNNRSAKIIVGGPFIYTQYRSQDRASLDYLFQSVIGADFYVINPQGEQALANILSRLNNRLPIEQIPNEIPNVFNNCIQEKEKKWPPIERENNILSENMVNWDLFAGRVGEYANIRTAISCPFSCAFCGFPRHAGKYQVAGVDEIEIELKTLDRIRKVKSIQFIDDTFNIPVKRFKEILRMLIRNKFEFSWHSHFRCQYADAEMAALMKESGCEGVFLGIESGNDQILTNMNKAVKVEQYLSGIELLKKNEILTYGSFIIGFPGETAETVQDTMRFIKESRLDFFRAQLWYCDPITPVWQHRKKYQLKGSSFEWTHSTMDSNRAADFVDQIFMTIQDPVSVPQYNFECDAIYHMLHRGLDLNQIKNFIRSFNNGVKEKLKQPSQQEISLNSIKQIKASLGEKNNSHDPDFVGEKIAGEKVNRMDLIHADFDFQI